MLNVNDMHALGLEPLQMAVGKGIRRPNSFRIYGSANELAKRGPNIYFDD